MMIYSYMHFFQYTRMSKCFRIRDDFNYISFLEYSYTQWRSQGGQPGICSPPPGPSAIRQALGRECTHQADQGEMVIYNYRVDKIQIQVLLVYLY